MILVYGGAFNPPTKAHYEIISLLKEKFHPNEFYLLPVGPQYNKPGVANYVDRFAMCELMGQKLGIKVSNMENEETYRGTYYALKEFSKIDKDVYFVMGADNFDYLDKWIMADKLVAEFKFIVLTREGYDVDKIYQTKFSIYRDNFVFIEYNSDISSSLYRKTRNKSLLITEVIEYINEKGLYKELN